jgi:hypothetical protein
MAIMPTVIRLLAATSFFTLLAPMQANDKGGNRRAFQNSDHLIVPGKRIGPVALGMSDQALFKLKVPDTTRVGGSLMWYFYSGLMKVVVDQNTHTVVCIEVYRDSSYHAVAGLRIGSSLIDIEKAMGPPAAIQGNPFFSDATENVIYKSGDIVFSFGSVNGSMAERPRDTVQSISMRSPGFQ